MGHWCTKCGRQYSGPFHLTWQHVISCFGLPSEGAAFTLWRAKYSNNYLVLQDYFLNHVPPQLAHDPNKRKKDVIWDALYHNGVRDATKKTLENILQKENLLPTFEADNFDSRMKISGLVADKKIYYRKMSRAEYDKSLEGGANPFKAAFDYTDKPLYRYWVSSSLPKVRVFGNENASSSGSGDVIVRMVFSEDVLTRFATVIKPHQSTGVQSDAKVVALHREGFAEIGNLDAADLIEVLRGNFDHNLGFTVDQSTRLAERLTSFAML